MTLGSHNRKNGGIARLLTTSKMSTTTLEKEALVTALRLNQDCAKLGSKYKSSAHIACAYIGDVLTFIEPPLVLYYYVLAHNLSRAQI